MDIEQLIFPFIMAVLTNSIMIVIVWFLRKIPVFANLFSVSFMAMLYLFCLLRIFVPIEFPDLQIIIEDHAFYASIIDFLVVYDTVHAVLHPSMATWIIIGVWIIGIVIFGLRSLFSQHRFNKYLTANGDYAADAERAVLSETAKDVLNSDKNVSLRKTDAVSGTIVIGLLRKIILIPDEEYAEDELRMMLRHECMHIKDKDLWIKLLVQIYCCVFWWNPFSYLLKRDLDLSLEMRCDLNAVKGLSDTDRLAYAETLVNRSKVEKNQKTPFVVSAGLVDAGKKDKLLERIQKLLSEPPKKSKQIAANTFAALILLVVFAGSYVFIWQPNFREKGPKEEYYELADGDIIVDEANAYLVKDQNGDYFFYYSDYPPVPVTKEEVEQGMYEDYPIYEK